MSTGDPPSEPRNDAVGSQLPVVLGCIETLLPVSNKEPKPALNANSSGVEFIVLP